MARENEEFLDWPLAAYGSVIRGDESTDEDQIAIASSPEIAERMVACWNACIGTDIESLKKARGEK